MNLGENIQNAFIVVKKTYENVDKLMRFCDSIANDFGYDAITNKFLRYKSDSYYGGWFIDSFIKLYQSKDNKVLENDWKDGPVYVMEINFKDKPKVYLSKFEYDNISDWPKGVSPAEYWGFSKPINCEGNDFKEKNINKREGYYVSEPKKNVKDKYWGIKRVVYTNLDLFQLTSDSISEKVFGQFDQLTDL